MPADTENGSKSNAGKIAIVVGIIVIVVLLAVIVILLLRKDNTAPVETANDISARGVVLNQNNAEDVLDKFVSEPTAQPGYYTASMTNEWHFSDSSVVSSDAYVQNLTENTNDVYFDVFLAEDEESPIYQSPIIPRGSYLDEIKLNKKMDAGTYDCILIYHLIDENQQDVSTLRVGIKIIIEQ